MKKFLFAALFLILVGFSGFICINYYSFIFAKTIQGEVIRVERVNTAEAIIASKNTPDSQLFSFALAIRDKTGEIHTSSTEDRQWAVVSPGQCVVARFFPYPPWKLEKGSTYFGARLERLFDCKSNPLEKNS